MKLTFDCVLTAELAHLQSDSTLSLLLAKGQITHVAQPLEALICEQFGLKQEGDFPIAAICASIDGLDVGEAYWLRADPVHFVMQRDCFSLSEPVPLSVSQGYAGQMLARLNQHFAQDGLAFYMGQSGAWYVRANQTQQIKTSLPSVAIDKNVHHFMPDGQDSAKWKAVLNEVQMLLHEHPANTQREVNGEVAVNSVWFSGGGELPPVSLAANEVDLVVAQSPLYHGFAKQTGIAWQVTTNLADILKSGATHVRVQLPTSYDKDGDWFQLLVSALKSKELSQVTLNLGFYEKCITIEIRPLDLHKFWRKSKPVAHYLT